MIRVALAVVMRSALDVGIWRSMPGDRPAGPGIILLAGRGSDTVLRWLSMPMRWLLRWLRRGSTCPCPARRLGPARWRGGGLGERRGPAHAQRRVAEHADPDPDGMAGLLDRVRAAGLPFCLQLRPGASPALAELAAARAMSLEMPIPLMVMEGQAAVTRPAAGRAGAPRAEPGSGRPSCRRGCGGLRGAGGPVRAADPPDVVRLPGVRCYLGEMAGRAVTTGLGVTLSEFVGVFNIATPPAHRRRGYGAAVTVRAVADGLAAGAKWSWLQSSALGYATYARLGFETVETWPCWVASN